MTSFSSESFRATGRWVDEVDSDTENTEQLELEGEEENTQYGTDEEVEEEEDFFDMDGCYKSSERSRSSEYTDMDYNFEERLELISKTELFRKPIDDLKFVQASQVGIRDFSIVRVDADSEGGVYYIRSNGKISAVFKPIDEEPGTPSCANSKGFVMRHGIPAGEGYVREVAAYLLDHNSFAGVPPTVVVSLQSKQWWSRGSCSSSYSGSGVSTLSPSSTQTSSTKSDSTTGESKCGSPQQVSFTSRFNRDISQKKVMRNRTMSFQERRPSCLNTTEEIAFDQEVDSSEASKLGSLQAYVSHHSSSEDIGFSLFSPEMVQRIGALDIRILNLDRHAGNILLQTVNEKKFTRGRLQRTESYHHSEPRNSTLKLIPIDHGLCLPKITEFRAELDGDSNADCVTLEWIRWPQAKQPFHPDVLAYISALDIEADVHLLETALEGLLGPEELLTFRVCTMLLQMAAAQGHNLFFIGSILQSGELVEMVKKAQLPKDLSDPNEITKFMDRFKTILQNRLE
mmetsp:Transcript_18859/g.30827  ORF Transcript_18859/g.30827 Transcript_18859/m.30827 type:complete len:514 (-) Transcript_18859:137-1678(-)|eukprot:CAMPEP_0203788110 /NCGR_PEP_ID=MMETSP0100_2-20121128/2646_1 /ASSEMBLY_ACC=CAM_ASM_000210 /TAXON_ID=96639 /ORGANISM=" , Strain NY0313808BC1" /LENGTH=513 /DNA_ID=CAMNT_0050690779 /DNA_START=311 /DNA_END=1852 /DNA_ORIENTATION=-